MMDRRFRLWLQLFLLIVVVGAAGLLLVGVGGVEGYSARARQMLDLRRTEVRLDRDLLRITAFQAQNYDALARDMRRIEELLDTPAQGSLAGDEPAYRRSHAKWRENLNKKLHLAQQVQSKSAIVRNELYYLSKAVEDYHHQEGKDANAIMELGHELLVFTLFDSTLRLRDIRAHLERLNRGEAQPGLRSNLLHHIERAVGYVWDLHRLMGRYQGIDTHTTFGELNQLINEGYTRQFQESEQRRAWLAALAVGLVLLLVWTLGGLARERRLAEQSRRRLSDAIESLREGFALFDAQGRLVLYNRQFAVDYPWIKELGAVGMPYDEYRDLKDKAGVRRMPLVEQGDADPVRAESGVSHLERLEDGQGAERWLLANDTLTSSGERVLVRVDVTEAKQRELELAKLHRAVEQIPVSVIITDGEGNIEYANPRFEQVTGYSLPDVVGRNPRFLKSGKTPVSVFQDLWAHLERGQTWHGELLNRRKDGSLYWEEAYISPVRDASGKTTHYIAFKEDISDRKHTEEAMRLHAKVFDTLDEGVLITDVNEAILAVNPAFSRITGYSEDEVLGQTPRLLSSGRQSRGFYQAMWQELKEQGGWQGEIEDRRRNGEIYPAWMNIVAVTDDRGVVTQYISVFSDITERKEAEARIRHQASYDALTGLPNRDLFLDRANHALRTAGREGTELALLFIDLDRFKEVNDTLGHLLGDELLKQVAERLQGCMREVDTVSRFGGDEFVILLEDVGSAENSATVASKVLQAVEKPLLIGGNEVQVGASIGITHYPEDAGDAVTLLRNADMAMYRAKEAGRNNYQFYTGKMNQQVQRRVTLAGELRRAIDQNALFVLYQPIVRIADRSLVAFEALLRWEHPYEGLVSPEVFILLAEETGLIGAIGEWVLTEACRQAAVWRSQGHDWWVGVNLSARQLALGLSVSRLQKIVIDSGLELAGLTLEVTEGLMLDGSEETLTWLQSVRDLGVHLSIDDFGTGYSSLSYLKRYPMNTLKIDRSFVRDIATDPSDASLVQATLAMAQSMGLEVVAEGVEDEQQLAFLEQNGCEFAQGWLFGKPMPAEEIDAFLARSGERIRDY